MTQNEPVPNDQLHALADLIEHAQTMWQANRDEYSEPLAEFTARAILAEGFPRSNDGPSVDERKWLDSFRRWTLEDVQNSPRTALGAIERLIAHIDSRRSEEPELTADNGPRARRAPTDDERAHALHDAFWAVHAGRFHGRDAEHGVDTFYAGTNAAKRAIEALHGSPIIHPWSPAVPEEGDYRDHPVLTGRCGDV